MIKKWWFGWLILGIVIRLALMPITLHPDLWGHSFIAYFFAYEGKWNIYETLAHLPATHPLVRNFGIGDIFIYPPLAYFTFGFFRILVKPFTDPNFIPFLWNLGDIHAYKGLFWQLFAYKLPYLFVDIGLGFILANLFNDLRKKRQAFALWMLNPVTIYATFMVGQFDILPTFFSVLGLYCFLKEKPKLGMISLGIGGAYKMYPLLFIIPAAFLISENLKKRLWLIFWGLVPFLLSIAPFLTSPAFRSMVFSPKSAKVLFMGWNVSGAEVIFPFIIFLVVIYFYSFYSTKKIAATVYLLAILLLLYSVTHYHPQWFLWVTPFFVWELVENNFKHLLLVLTLFAAWLFITFFFEPSLTYGLFNPLWPALERAKSLSDMVGKYTDVFRLKSIIRSVFAGASIYYIWRLFKPEIN